MNYYVKKDPLNFNGSFFTFFKTCFYSNKVIIITFVVYIEKHMKKINILTIVLLGYLLIMSYIGWPGRKGKSDYTEYFIVIGVSVVIIFLLRFLRIRLLKIRNKQKEDK